MKKISLLKKLTIGIAPLAVATPLFFTATSCSTTSGIVTKYISFNKFRDDKKLDASTNGYFSNDELLLGTKKFCNGNYILLIGSNAYDLVDGKTSTTAQFFCGPNNPSRNINLWFTNYLQDSVWFKDVQSTTVLSKIDRDFAFATFIDDFNFKFYDGNNHEYEVFDTNGVSIQNIGPFDKWGDGGMIEKTRQMNKEKHDYEWDKDEKVKSTDYIRQDEQARAFRSFIQRGASMFPTTESRTKTFDSADNNKTGTMAIYKDGRLVDIVDLPTVEKEKPEVDDPDKETTTLFGTINKYFTKEEEK